MATLGSLIVNVLANTSHFEKGMQKARAEIRSLESVMGKGIAAIGGLQGALAGVGIAIGTQQLISSLQETAQEIDNLVKLTDRLGVSTQAFIGLQYGAGLAGVSAEQLASSMQTMTKQIGEAIHGGGKAKVVFDELGISAKQLGEMTPEQQLMALSNALGGVEKAAERTRIAMRLFGADGAAMLNFLAEGEGAIREYIVEAEKLGLTYSREEAAKVEEFNDAWDKLKQTLGGLKTSVVIKIAPEAIKWVEDLQRLVDGNAKPRAKSDSMWRNLITGQTEYQQTLMRDMVKSELRHPGRNWMGLPVDRGAGPTGPVDYDALGKQHGPAARNRALAARYPFGTNIAANLDLLAAASVEEQSLRNQVKAAAYFGRKALDSMYQAPDKLKSAFGWMGKGIKDLKATGAEWQRKDTLRKLFPGEDKVGKFFRDKAAEEQRKIHEVGMQANRRMLEGMERERRNRFASAPSGVNEAIQAGTVEAFRVIAESRIQQQMLDYNKRQTQLLQQIESNLRVDVSGLDN